MADDWLEPYRGQIVICDLVDGYMIFGTLCGFSSEHLEFRDADLHDLREANSTKDVYAIETLDIGVRVNRQRCAISRLKLIAISRLDEVAR
jgi:hypothetical protein